MIFQFFGNQNSQMEQAQKNIDAALKASSEQSPNVIITIRKAKKSLERAKKEIEKYAITQKDYDNLARLEQNFNKALNMLPLTSKVAMIKEFETSVDALFIFSHAVKPPASAGGYTASWASMYFSSVML